MHPICEHCKVTLSYLYDNKRGRKYECCYCNRIVIIPKEGEPYDFAELRRIVQAQSQTEGM